MGLSGWRPWWQSVSSRDGLSGGLNGARVGRGLGDCPVGELPEGGDELAGPGPSGCDTQGGASTGADQHAGGVEEAVAESFGFSPGQFAFQA